MGHGSPRMDTGLTRLLPLEIRVRQTLTKFNMLSPGMRVLVAVSGGADSMALLHCLHRLAPRWNVNLAAAHLNHRLRGEESDRDECFVRAACERLEVPIYTEGKDVADTAASSGRNLEETARQVRYDFLRRTAARAGAQKIALGHTLDDQAETVLLRFLRGSASEGLSAIHPVVHPQIIRPLLECGRRNILEYLEIRGISFREDSSNSDLRYRRNRVRRELIPYLKEHFNPRLSDTLATEAELARELADYMESQAREVLELIRIREGDGLSLSVSRLMELHPALRKAVLRLALRECRGDLRGVTARHTAALSALCLPLHSGRRISLPGGAAVVRQFGSIHFARQRPVMPQSFSYILPIPGRCLVAEAGMEFVSALAEPDATAVAPVKSGRFRVVLDAISLPARLMIRSRHPGDRYGGRRKVKKMLIDAKVPLSERPRIPVVAAGETVIWIPGFKPPKAYIPQSNSVRYVILEAIERKPEQGDSG